MSSKLVPYDVVYCSSEDESHRIDHLVGNTYRSISFEDGTPGWQTSVGVEYPQVLILRFSGNVYIQQLRILSHECKIASKVEVRTYSLKYEELLTPPSFRSVSFTKLGYVEFNPNLDSRYESKERKNIHLRAEAYFLKLLFHNPFENEHNRGKQVGLYSIECLGKQLNAVQGHSDDIFQSSGGVVVPLTDDDVNKKKEHPASRKAANVRPPGKQGEQLVPTALAPPPTPFSTLPKMMFRSIPISQFDTFFIQRAEELIAMNDAAATLGDKEVVMACQASMNTLNSIADEMYTLEQEKLAAILEEDFEEAARVKEAMTEVVEVALRETELPGISRGQEEQSSANYLLHSRQVGSEKWRIEDYTLNSSSTSSVPYNGQEDNQSPLVESLRSASNPTSTQNPYRMLESSTPTAGDREIAGKRSRALRQEDIVTDKEKEVVRFMYEVAGASEEKRPVYPPEVPIDIQRMNSAVGPYITACLVSKRFKLREAALVAVTERMSDAYKNRAAEVEEAMLRFLDDTNFGLQDNISSVVQAALIYIRFCLGDEFHCIDQIISPLSNLVPRLLTRAADSLLRIREEAIGTLEQMVQQPVIPSSVFLSAILSGPVNKLRSKVRPTNSRMQVARLRFLQILLQENRLSGNPSQMKQLYSSVLLLCINHSSSEVRDMGVNLTTSLIQRDLIKPSLLDIVKITNPALQDVVKSEAQQKGTFLTSPLHKIPGDLKSPEGLEKGKNVARKIEKRFR